MVISRSALYDGIYGLAVADALGVPFEFSSYEKMKKEPCTEMVGYGHHNQPAGTWSDDTSMTLCTADSLCNGFDPDDMMKKFLLWMDHGEYTAGGKVFDVGITCRKALNKYRNGIPALYCGGRKKNSNGNGALMRIFPMALYESARFENDERQFLKNIHSAAGLTHANFAGLMCCGFYSLFIKEWCIDNTKSLKTLFEAAFEKGKTQYLQLGEGFAYYIQDTDLFQAPSDICRKADKELLSSGYAVDTWNIAVWSLLTTKNYRDCVLKAINLGFDTDTNGAVAGALAGLVYGKNSIPEEWINALQNKELIDTICAKFNQKVLGYQKKKNAIAWFGD